MKTVFFTTEIKSTLDSKDLLIVRNLYQPKIGKLATSVFQLLVDHNTICNGSPEWNNLSEISSTLNVTITEVKKTFSILGAAGLIRTWEKNDSSKIIIKINKPQKASELRSSLLYSVYKGQITEVNYERIEMFLERNVKIKKENFRENTSNFFDIFKVKNQPIQNNTLEIPLVEPETIEKAIIGLSAPSFVKYITKRECSPTIIENINLLRQYGFSSESINLINNYSFKVNEKIVCAYVNKIANNLLEKGIIGANQIRLELINAFKNKTTSTKFVVKEDLSKEDININKNFPKTEKIEWDDLFNKIGDL